MSDGFDELFEAAKLGDSQAIEKLRSHFDSCKSKGGRPRATQRDFELSMWVEAACEKYGWKRTHAFDKAGDLFKTQTGKSIGLREARRSYSRIVGKKHQLEFWVLLKNDKGVLCVGSTAKLNKMASARIDERTGCRFPILKLAPSGPLKQGRDCFLVFFDKSMF